MDTNVYAFLNQLKAMVQLKTEPVVRAHIPLALRGAASRWYTTELSDQERDDLNTERNIRHTMFIVSYYLAGGSPKAGRPAAEGRLITRSPLLNG